MQSGSGWCRRFSMAPTDILQQLQGGTSLSDLGSQHGVAASALADIVGQGLFVDTKQ